MKHGADLESRDEVGNTPILNAIAARTFFLLAENGADITAKNNNNIPASIHAVLQKKVKVMKYLFEHGAEIANAKDINHSTSLMFASNKGPLEHGADPNAANKNCDTPLHAAANCVSAEIIKILLDHDGNPNIHNNDNYYPLFFAVYENTLDAVRALVEGGADINAVSSNTVHPLMNAFFHGKNDIAEYLIEKGADINFIGKNGLSPLCYAANKGSYKTVEMFLNHGADVDITIEHGYTPLIISCTMRK